MVCKVFILGMCKDVLKGSAVEYVGEVVSSEDPASIDIDFGIEPSFGIQVIEVVIVFKELIGKTGSEMELIDDSYLNFG